MEAGPLSPQCYPWSSSTRQSADSIPEVPTAPKNWYTPYNAWGGSSRRNYWKPSHRDPLKYPGGWYNSTRQRRQPNRKNDYYRPKRPGYTNQKPRYWDRDSKIRDRGRPKSSPTIPQMITPSAKDQNFTRIMSRAFDTKDSPLALGEKLASLGSQPLMSQNKAKSSENSNTLPSSDSGVFGKDITQTIPHSELSNQVKSENCFSNDSTIENNRFTGFSPAHMSTDALTVGFGFPAISQPVEVIELNNLMSKIQENTRQSMVLSQLVSQYIDTTTNGSPLWPFVKPSKPLNDDHDTDRRPLVATIAGGGDSPDPPGDRYVPCRGHMIDQVDVNVSNTSTENNQDDRSSNGISAFGNDQKVISLDSLNCRECGAPHWKCTCSAAYLHGNIDRERPLCSREACRYPSPNLGSDIFVRLYESRIPGPSPDDATMCWYDSDRIGESFPETLKSDNTKGCASNGTNGSSHLLNEGNLGEPIHNKPDDDSSRLASNTLLRQQLSMDGAQPNFPLNYDQIRTLPSYGEPESKGTSSDTASSTSTHYCEICGYSLSFHNH